MVGGSSLYTLSVVRAFPSSHTNNVCDTVCLLPNFDCDTDCLARPSISLRESEMQSEGRQRRLATSITYGYFSVRHRRLSINPIGLLL